MNLQLSIIGNNGTYIGMKDQILRALQSGLLPLGNLLNLGRTGNGYMVAAFVTPELDLTDGPVEVKVTDYQTGINHIQSLTADTGYGYGYLIIEDTDLPLDAGAELAQMAIAGLYQDGVVRKTNSGLAQMPTPSTVADRLRLVTTTGQQLILDCVEIFGTEFDISRLSISSAYDGTTDDEYIVLIAEGGNTIYVAEMSALATVPDATTAVGLFQAVNTIAENEIVRLTKPEDGNPGLVLVDERTATLTMDNGETSIQVPPLAATASDTETDPALVDTLEPSDGISASSEVSDTDDDTTNGVKMGMSPADDTAPTLGNWGINLGRTTVVSDVPVQGWVQPAADSVTLRLAQVV